MQVLREISQQTADNTSATSNAIGRLADLSAQLRRSVSGFRLPHEPPARPQAARLAASAPSSTQPVGPAATPGMAAARRIGGAA
jgi:twitching motility protein PilJ